MKRQLILLATTVILVSLVMCSFSVTAEAADDGSGTVETVDPDNIVTYTYLKTIDDETTKYTLNYLIDTESKTADVYGFPDNVDTSVNKIRIPGTITVDDTEYVVMDIAPNAFKDNDWLKTVNIEDNGSSEKRVVGENAFANASSLYLLNYPVNNVGGGFVSIGNGAFSGTDLTSPNFQKITFIGADAFKDCTKLTNANINNVTEIGDGAFSGCTSLSIVNAKALTKAGANAFSGCTALKTVNAQELTDVGAGAFSGCTALTDVSLGECDSVLELFKDSAKLEYITIAGVYHPIVNGSIGEYDDTNSLFKIGSNYYPTLATALSNLDDGEKLTLLKNLEVSSVSIERVDDFIFDLGGNTLTLTSQTGMSLLNSTGVLQNGDVVSTFNGNSEEEEAVAIHLTVLCELTVSGVDVVIQSTSKDASWNNSGFVLESQSKLMMENGSTVSSKISDDAYGSIGVVILGPGSDKTSPTELIINKGVSITVGQYGISGNGSIIMENDSGDDTGSGEQETGVATQDEGGDPASVKKDFRNTSITISGATVSAEYGWGIYHPQIGTLVVKDGAIISGVTGIEMRSGSLTVDGATITAAKEYRSDSVSEASSVYGAAIAVAPYRSADELGTVTVDIVDGSFEGGVAFAQSNPDKVTGPGFDFSVSGGTFTSTGTNSGTGGTYPAIVAEEKEAAGKFVTGGTFKSGDAADNTVGDYVDDNYELAGDDSGTVDIKDPSKAVAVVDGKNLATIDDVMEYAATNNGCTVQFLQNVTLSTQWVITNTMTIDLNDRTLTNGVTNGSMILIDDGASVTITDSGTNGKISDNSTETTIVAKNGSTLVIKSGTFYKNAVEGTILEAKGNLTVDGGLFDFDSTVDDNRGYAIRVTYGAKAVINDVTINSEKAGILVRGYDSDSTSTELTVENATINSSYYAFAVFGHGYEDDGDNDNVVLTVKNATVTMPTDSSNPESAAFGTNADGGANAGHTINIEGGTYTSNTGCYFPSYGKYNISGGTFNSSLYGVRICAGELTIYGSASITVDAEGTTASLVPDDGKTDRPTGIMGPLTIGKQTSDGYPGAIVVNIKGGMLTNNTDGGNAITVYDDNLASTTYNNQKVSVIVSGGTVTGDVEYVHTNDTVSDSNDVSYEMTGGTVDGDIVADESVASTIINVTSGVVTGEIAGSSNQPTGTVLFPEATEPVNFYGSFTMPAAPAERPGYTFMGYCLDENGTGTIYQPGATVSGASGAVTVYEIWEETSVVFDFGFDELTFYLENGENNLSGLISAEGVTVTYSVSDTTVATGGSSVTILSVGTATVTATGDLGDRKFTDSFTLEIVGSPGIEGLVFNPVRDTMEDLVRSIQVDFVPVSDFLESTVMDIGSEGTFVNGPIPYASLGWDIDASNYDDYDYYVIHYGGDDVPIPESVGVTATADGLVVEFEDFSPFLFGYVAKEVVDPEPDPPFNPGWGGNDDDVYIPPTIVVDDSSSSDDDEMVKVAACAAAAVAAAIIALILVAEYRKR